ncbi:MAG TPA: decarboxylating 6-phosphogluconate dehydrogenase [Ignavibacteria bacterium]|nr:decarboxylating 6-phosphogluconate dehydrogenase [Bacteroidota bacterium]HRI85339.1 decarboxylating 6-phosphogluconate dehydrogenase [Ignavibacteria bacterium]HRK00741.1 decarboxylating 6-phosphogluconate dehydrogenase [Ignavibacteria bacterium]
MKIGFIGLGKMGAFMVERLLIHKHEVVVYNRTPEKTNEISKKGAEASFSLSELVSKLPSPKVVWMMIPSGDPVQKTIEELIPLLGKGDIIIDGGNSYYKDSVRRAAELDKYGINYMDTGTSGGIWGLELGYCVMVGGEKNIFDQCEPVFKSLAPENGYMYIGKAGAGHYVKMIHNGIEYGMMQAFAEGFELMHKSDYNIDLQGVADLWDKGSVVRSWLLQLLANALKEDKNLSTLKDYVEDSGEGRWTVIDGIEKSVPVNVIADSLFARFRSRQDESFGGKILAALRNEFGGHSVKKK